MPEVVRKLAKKPEPEKVQEPVSVDVEPIAKALEMQGRLLAAALMDAMKQQPQPEPAKKWVFTIVRNPRTGDLERIVAERS